MGLHIFIAVPIASMNFVHACYLDMAVNALLSSNGSLCGPTE